jgi:hypothetical protein
MRTAEAVVVLDVVVVQRATGSEREGVIRRSQRPRTSTATFRENETVDQLVKGAEEDLARDENGLPGSRGKAVMGIEWSVVVRGKLLRNSMLRWTTIGEVPTTETPWLATTTTLLQLRRQLTMAMRILI